MSVKDIKEAIEKGCVYFGIRQTLKNPKNLKSVFVSKDCRDEVIEKLEKAGLEFDVLKTKMDLAKELNLDFECEVFSIYKKSKGVKKK
jgi:ribosomal protein L30E